MPILKRPRFPSTPSAKVSASYHGTMITVPPCAKSLSNLGHCAKEPTRHRQISYLRSTAFVTAVHGDQSVTQAQRESVARAMRHSESTAASSYNAATARDRVLIGLDIATAWRNAGAGAGAGGGAPISSGVGSGTVARFSKVEPSASVGESASEDDGATTSNDEDELDKDDRGNEGASESFYELEKLVAMRRRLGEVEWLCRWAEKGAADTWEPEINVPSWAVRMWFERACEARKTVAKVRAVASLGAGGGGGKRARHGGGAGAGGGGL
jgi:hypothetical protein